jgi:thiol-disulfide isomerase/thioredoxin
VEAVLVLVKRHFPLLFLVAVILASYGAVRAVQAVGHNGPSPATQLPSIPFYDKYGNQVTLDAFKGKVVLVNLWATWCEPCAAEMASLDHLQGQLSRDKFRVVALSVDRSSVKTVEKFMQKRAIANLDIYWDQDRQVPMKWKYEGLPTSFLIDRQGTVIARYDGPYEWDKAPFLKEIGDLLN